MTRRSAIRGQLVRIADALELGKTAERGRNIWRAARRGRARVGQTPADLVHQENKWRLLRYRSPAGRRFQTPILLVPSLINRHYVLDLAPGRSFAEYLVHRGHDVFIIDWGRPQDEDRYVTFDDITDRYLGRALKKVNEYSPSGRAHVLGYCLGGTLAVIHAAAYPERFASLLALAAPVAFDVDGILNNWMRLESFDVDALVDGTGNVPWPLMQLAFHMIRPTLNLSKAVHLIDRAWDDEFLDGFLAIERWGNDNVSFPGEAYRTYIRDLYRDDKLIRDELRLGNRQAKLSNIDCPTMVITFEHDNIVPGPSATPLVEKISSRDKQHIHLPGGHVGAVISRKASSALWPGMSDWWAARDDAP